ncbi:radical SAM protein [Candidatus Sumerlaeota bacterium]|nr:radical SAM protein [Candidatus Sumerlaeota bacterium]
MAKALLIALNPTEEPYPVYPLGMSMVAEATRARGHEAVEWDWLHGHETGETLDRVVERCRPDVVGLSLRNIDNVDSVQPDSYTDSYRDAVGRLRGLTDVPIVLGGAGFSLFPEALMEKTGADYGVAGDGERVFPDLLDRIERGDAPRERILRDAAPLRGDEIRSPVRDAALASYYLREGGMLNVQTKRGCPYRCAYCSYPVFEGRAYRFRPPEDVVDEIEAIRDRHGADFVAFTDSVFNDAEDRYLAIAEEMVRREVRVPWMAFCRPRRFRPEQVDLLKRSGMACVEWGTDCSTDATLDAMRKDFTWGDVEESNRLFTQAGIASAHFIIFGGPGETRETLHEGLDNIERLTDCVVFAYRGVRIFPETHIRRLAVEMGTIEENEALLDPRFFFSPDVTPDSLHEAILASFASRTDRIYPPGQDIDRIRAFHRMGHRGPVWNLLTAQGRGGTSVRRRGRTGGGQGLA